MLDRVTLPAPARVLDRDSAGAAPAQRLPHGHEPVGDAAAYDHVLGLDDHRARPRQVSGHGVAQLCGAAVWSVGEPHVGQLSQRPVKRRPPAAARKRVVVGLAGPEVVAIPKPGRLDDRAPGGNPPRSWERGDAGRRSAPGRQVALRDQLRVAVDHDSARHAQLVGQQPARRERRAGREPSRANRDPQRVLELPAVRLGRGRSGGPPPLNLTAVDPLGFRPRSAG